MYFKIRTMDRGFKQGILKQNGLNFPFITLLSHTTIFFLLHKDEDMHCAMFKQKEMTDWRMLELAMLT